MTTSPTNNPDIEKLDLADVYTLNHFEIRILGVLAEKEATTPDIYPLTLNAVVNGCNQLSNRSPVMKLTEEVVSRTLLGLRDKKLVFLLHQAGARVAKYSHNLRGVFPVNAPHIAILTVLFLRAEQTAGELRQRCERLYRFASLDAVNLALTDLMQLTPPLVAQLPLAPGAKEARYIHLLTDQPHIYQATDIRHEAGQGPEKPQGRLSELENEVKNLQRELAWLVSEFENFKKQFE